MAGGGFEELIVWRKSIEPVKHVYHLTEAFPSQEKFGLMSQMRRAAVSVPSNIAEGHARHTTREYARFVSNAQGSLAELYTQVRIAVEVELCDERDTAGVVAEITEVRKMLNALRRQLNGRIAET
jgi:four helix bundle protein